MRVVVRVVVVRVVVVRVVVVVRQCFPGHGPIVHRFLVVHGRLVEQVLTVVRIVGFLVVSRVGFGVGEQGSQLGHELPRGARRQQQLEGAHARAAAHQAVELFEHPRCRALVDLFSVADEGPLRLVFDAKAEARCELDGPQHAYGVFAKAHVRVANRANQMRLDVRQTAHVIDDGLLLDVVEQAVHREVSAVGVFLFGAEDVVPSDEQFAVVGCVGARVGSKRRRLDDLVAEEHVGQTKPATDDSAVAEQLLDFARRRTGGHVEIFGLPTQKKVADAAAYQVRLVPVTGEAPNYLVSVRVDQVERNRHVTQMVNISMKSRQPAGFRTKKDRGGRWGGGKACRGRPTALSRVA